MDSQTANVQRLEHLAAGQPDELAYVHLGMDGRDRHVRYADLVRRSSQIAAAFQARGVGYGDMVGLGIRNSPELVYSVLAAWRLGAVPVPVRWDVPDWELDRLKQAVSPRLYVGPDQLDWIAATEDDEVAELPHVISPHVSGICSSGSTGTPKIIVSQSPAVFDPLLSVPIAVEWGIEVARPQRILVLAPMYHVNAFTAITNLIAGDRLFVLEKFDAGRILDAIETHRITTFTATPTMLQRISDHPSIGRRDLSSLVWVMQGAAPMPPSLVRTWADLIGAERIIMAYGGTEAIGLTVIDGREWMSHPGSVGRPFRGARLRVVDDELREVPPGQVGHIFLKPPEGTQPAVYLGEVPQMPTTEDGYGTYGDMGHVDSDGYLYLADRRVDLIVSGGANIFPAEVEAALIDHPKVADVVVIGLPDEEWGKRVHAIVEATDPSEPPSFEEIKAYAKSRLLPYKVPKTLEVVDSIPRSEAMKVNRGRLVAERSV